MILLKKTTNRNAHIITNNITNTVHYITSYEGNIPINLVSHYNLAVYKKDFLYVFTEF